MICCFELKSGKAGRQVLQRAVLSGPVGAELLYWRPQENSQTIGTDTYVNLFHKSRWQHLTGLSDFGLDIYSGQPGQVRVFGLDGSQDDPKLLDECRLPGGSEPAGFELKPEADFFFFDWTPDHSAAPLPMAEYTAELKPGIVDPHIALVITTFNRVDDLRQTVGTYIQARNDFLEINRLTHLYVINNQPQDTDRLAGLMGDGVTLINNPVNSGGAGGFGRGAREAVASGLYSHVLFMDDDVMIHPEAWLRTLALVRNLKPLYAEQVVSGGMLSRERLTYCHTLSEALDQKVKHLNLTGKLDLADIVQTRQALTEADLDFGYPQAASLPPQAPLKPYAAWWYCLIPVKLFRQYGYPLPVFFRGDDQEFGLRIKRKALSLNGIFVWHPSFESFGKTSLLRAYLGARNRAIYTTLHFKNWRKLISLRFIRLLNRSLAANDYEKAAAMIMAFVDYMEFGRRTPMTGSEIMDRLEGCRSAFKNTVLEEDVTVPPVELPANRQNWFYSLIVVPLTLGGALIPDMFFRQHSIMAEFAQIQGKFPARYVAYPRDRSIKAFNRGRALKLAVIGLSRWLWFLISSRRIRTEVEALAASCREEGQ